MKREILKYAIVGVFNTFTDFLIFIFLFYTVGAGLVLSNTIAFLVSVIQSFIVNKHWTFSDIKQDRGLLRQGGMFLIINTFGLGISNLTIVTMADFVHPLLAKIGATVIVFVWGFVMSKLLVFK